jgi:hypothetical protein
MIFEARRLVAAVDEVTFGELGEERGLLDGRVAAADHGDLLVAEEEPVAGGAGGQAVAEQLGLLLEAEHERLRAGGDDDRVGPVGGLGSSGVAPQTLNGRSLRVDLGDLRR